MRTVVSLSKFIQIKNNMIIDKLNLTFIAIINIAIILGSIFNKFYKSSLVVKAIANSRKELY